MLSKKLEDLCSRWETYVCARPDQGKDYDGYYAGHDACAFQLRAILNEETAPTSGSEAGGETANLERDFFRMTPRQVHDALAKPASEPADGAVREAAIGLFENFVRSTACGHVVRGLITDERAAVWTQEIVDDFRASLAALSAPASSSPAEETKS